MEIVSVEALDKAGKYTQTKKLVEYLRLNGYKVAQSEFPRYDTPTGKLIHEWLTRKWNVDQRTIEFILAADRQAQQHWFGYLEKKGYDFLILDRYTSSQRAYAVATGSDPDWVESIQRYMRKPDLEILIDITPEESMRRKGKHNNGTNDRYEEDIELLKRVRELYKSKPCIIINGMQTIDEVHRDIVDSVMPILSKR